MSVHASWLLMIVRCSLSFAPSLSLSPFATDNGWVIIYGGRRWHFFCDCHRGVWLQSNGLVWDAFLPLSLGLLMFIDARGHDVLLGAKSTEQVNRPPPPLLHILDCSFLSCCVRTYWSSRKLVKRESMHTLPLIPLLLLAKVSERRMRHIRGRAVLFTGHYCMRRRSSVGERKEMRSVIQSHSSDHLMCCVSVWVQLHCF